MINKTRIQIPAKYRPFLSSLIETKENEKSIYRVVAIEYFVFANNEKVYTSTSIKDLMVMIRTVQPIEKTETRKDLIKLLIQSMPPYSDTKHYELGCYSEKIEKIPYRDFVSFLETITSGHTNTFRFPNYFIEIEHVDNEIDITLKDGTFEKYYG